MGTVPRATLLDKLGLAPQVLATLTSSLLRFITRPVTGGNKPKSVFRDVAYAALRTYLKWQNAAREVWLAPKTGANYRAFVKANHLPAETSTLQSGLQLHWFGPRSAQKTILYLHGGGYVLGATSGHLRWLCDLQKDLAKEQSINLVIVEYTLAPQAQYPTQLGQAAEALKWLIESEKKSPKDIILGGDSAGGNLALALLFHIVRPQPQVSEIVELSEPLSACLLISPWTDFSAGREKHRNAGSDMINGESGGRWSSLFMGSATRDDYNQPSYADQSYFEGLKHVVERILVWGGSYELIIDSIEPLGKKIQQVHPQTEVIIEPEAAHEGFILDLTLGYKEKAQGTKLIESWILAK